MLAGFMIVLTSSGGEANAADPLAFADTSNTQTEELVRRPVGNPCAASDYSVVFDEDVLLASDGASNVGPFDIALPDGVYKVTLSTWLGGQDVAEETNEQWSFSTDSGYRSPTTIDSSPHLLMNQAFDAQEISATTSVQLHHFAPPDQDNANSVHPLCIGFDLTEDHERVVDPLEVQLRF